jgi:hypothetical protein
MKQADARSIVAMALLLLGFGCAAREGKLAAETMGDLTYAPLERARPDTEHVERCGHGALTETGARTLRRRPYVQSVTADSAILMFTQTGDPALVDVTRPDGTRVASVSARREPSAEVWPGVWQVSARLQSLEPSTLYCYSLRGLTERAGFRTAPAADSSEVVRFIAFGDSGDGGDNQYAVKNQMLTVPFDFVLHTGDVAYDDGTLAQLEAGFFRVYQSITRSFATFPVAGNHDYATASAAPLRQAFALPQNGMPGEPERCFSFDWGHVHVAGLDTDRIGAALAAWLDADLAATDRPWKIVFAHEPPLSSGEHGSNAAFRRYLVPVVERHGVALVLSGHDHDYERTRPISGTTYIVTGGGGRGTRAVRSSAFTAFSEDTLHFVQVEVHASELVIHAIDGTGVEFDSARIERTR